MYLAKSKLSSPHYSKLSCKFKYFLKLLEGGVFLCFWFFGFFFPLHVNFCPLATSQSDLWRQSLGMWGNRYCGLRACPLLDFSTLILGHESQNWGECSFGRKGPFFF